MPSAIVPMRCMSGSSMSAWNMMSAPSGPAPPTMLSTVMGMVAMWLP